MLSVSMPYAMLASFFIFDICDAFCPPHFIQLRSSTKFCVSDCITAKNSRCRTEWIQPKCSVYDPAFRIRLHFFKKNVFDLNAIGRGRGTPSEEAWQNAQEVVDEKRQNPGPATNSNALVVRPGEFLPHFPNLSPRIFSR